MEGKHLWLLTEEYAEYPNLLFLFRQFVEGQNSEREGSSSFLGRWDSSRREV